jgi:hypothetical protein
MAESRHIVVAGIMIWLAGAATPTLILPVSDPQLLVRI